MVGARRTSFNGASILSGEFGTAPQLLIMAHPEVETCGRGGATMTFLGQTKAGFGRTQPCRGIAWWANRDDERQRWNCFLHCFQILIEPVDPNALKISARRADYSLTESALTPFQAEPTHSPLSQGFLQINMGSPASLNTVLQAPPGCKEVRFFSGRPRLLCPCPVIWQIGRQRRVG
jgi:hypothetical protein